MPDRVAPGVREIPDRVLRLFVRAIPPALSRVTGSEHDRLTLLLNSANAEIARRAAALAKTTRTAGRKA